ncbi:MAG: hypothetical protein DRG11_03575 [Epsilonproteobacteria bacterium]|nr:MAG: hypothetical protein DRG11_03575 [Campylobacterota bacterium]
METKTIDKLQDALEKLLGAYEELQTQKDITDDENMKLKDQNDLINSKIFEYERTDGEKDIAIGDMLDKIETVLDEDNTSHDTNLDSDIDDKTDDNDIIKFDATNDDSIVQNTNDNDKDTNKNKTNEKLELNRLDNLMEGFL